MNLYRITLQEDYRDHPGDTRTYSAYLTRNGRRRHTLWGLTEADAVRNLVRAVRLSRKQGSLKLAGE